MILATLLVIYVLGFLYFGLFVAAPVLSAADCDHAFIILFSWAIILVPLWPAVLIYSLVTLPFRRDA